MGLIGFEHIMLYRVRTFQHSDVDEEVQKEQAGETRRLTNPPCTF